MKRTEIRQLYRQTPADGTVVTVCGWAKTVRDSKNIGFIELSVLTCSSFRKKRQTALMTKITGVMIFMSKSMTEA